MNDTADLTARLSQAGEAQRRKQKLQRNLEEAQASLASERQHLAELESGLKKEELDVKRLEGLSLTGLFYTLLGSKENQLEKERQEYLAAQLKAAHGRYSVESLEREITDLLRQLDGLKDIEAVYQGLVAEKAQRLASASGEEARKIAGLDQAIFEQQGQLKEVDEALQAGQAAQAGLETAKEALLSAEGWGVWDLLGGGLLASAVKHSRLDDARLAASQAQVLLDRFQRELEDLGPDHAELVLEIKSFERFIDVFFDNQISDWIIQTRISDSVSNVMAFLGRVKQIQSRLQAQKDEIQSRLETLARERQQFVEAPV